tara:strand:- start:6688 stop:7755 length:1068 start_codon:yes stop_codon:yes gene_type:complete
MFKSVIMKSNFVLISYVVLTLTFTGCGDKIETREAEPIKVKVTTISGENSQQRYRAIGYSGIINPSKSITLSFQVSGTVERVPVAMGSFVIKGTLLAEIDETTYRNQYQAQAAQAELAKENYLRTKEVFEKGSIAEIKMIEARSNYQQAKSSADATYQNIKHTKIFAPVSGYIGEKMLEAGDLASPGKPVLKLLQIDVVKASVPIPDEEINNYKKGDPARVTIEALDDEEFMGVVDEVSIQTAQDNPTYTAKINIDNPDRRIKPGMSCSIVLNNERKESTMTFIVPVEAVYADEKGNQFVYLADNEANNAYRQQIKTGKLYNNGIAVTEGLKDGDLLITSGYHKLTDKTPIQIIK